MSAGFAVAVTVAVTELIHPLILVLEYVIVVDPEVFAVTTPLEELILATLVFEEDHVPPEFILDKVVVKPAQIVVSPEIGESDVG